MRVKLLVLRLYRTIFIFYFPGQSRISRADSSGQRWRLHPFHPGWQQEWSDRPETSQSENCPRSRWELESALRRDVGQDPGKCGQGVLRPDERNQVAEDRERRIQRGKEGEEFKEEAEVCYSLVGPLGHRIGRFIQWRKPTTKMMTMLCVRVIVCVVCPSVVRIDGAWAKRCVHVYGKIPLY